MHRPPVRIGTSSWSSEDWVGPFYPAGSSAADQLPFYATRFDTVECDATFYRIPSRRTVEGWASRTPPGFVFSLKLPREITHDKGLVDCGESVSEFLRATEPLGDKLGAILAQFAYVAKGKDAAEYATGDDFRRRLVAFLDGWPKDRRLAVEVRNGSWVAPPLLDLLRSRGVALALAAYYTMPPPGTLFAGPDPQTTDLLYVRFIGDHKRMDRIVEGLRSEGKRTGDWSAIAVDRTDEMRSWMRPLRERAGRGAEVFAYFNNHYAGFAPDSARLFRQLWEETA